jgi:hypothetical protein
MQQPDNIRFLRVYWVSGPAPKGSGMTPSVKDPPCAGWSGAVQVVGEKMSWLLCPHTLSGYQVRTDCYEIATAQEVSPSIEKVVNRIQDTWKRNQKLGIGGDFDIAARVLKALGAEVPTEVVQKDGSQTKETRGGKEAAERIIKPVKRSSKRGKVLAYVLEKGGAIAIRDVMAEFDATRSSVLSTMYILNKDHGIGYTLAGDELSVQMPADCDEVME